MDEQERDSDGKFGSGGGTTEKRAEEKFKKGDKVKDNRGEEHIVESVNHPMVYTNKARSTSPGGGIHHTKLYK